MTFHHQNKWTFVIPAAGRSTRFHFSERKFFFKIDKISIIEFIVRKIEPYCKRIILIIRKEDKKKLNKIFNNLKKIKYVYQKKPNGMASAVSLGLKHSKTLYTAVMWADQVGIKSKTILKTINVHMKMNNLISFPVVNIKDPYTLVKFKKGKLIYKIIQSREEKIKDLKGFTDCGFFCVNTNQLENRLSILIKKKKIITTKTKEYDFLKSFEHLSKKSRIFSIISKNKIDCFGINTRKDAKFFKKCLKSQ